VYQGRSLRRRHENQQGPRWRPDFRLLASKNQRGVPDFVARLHDANLDDGGERSPEQGPDQVQVEAEWTQDGSHGMHVQQRRTPGGGGLSGWVAPGKMFSIIKIILFCPLGLMLKKFFSKPSFPNSAKISSTNTYTLDLI
jgi:hypothetical protein